jgi:hypothetical protein
MTGSSEAGWKTGNPGLPQQPWPPLAPGACLSRGLMKAGKDPIPSGTRLHLQVPFSLLLRL